MLLNLAILFSVLPLVSSFETQKPIRSNSEGPLDSKIDILVKKALDLWHVPGLSIAVVDGDHVWAEVSELSWFRSTIRKSAAKSRAIIMPQGLSRFLFLRKEAHY